MLFQSHTGQVRQHNEDSVAVFPQLGLAIVADGMGGHDAGEVASALAVEHIQQQVAAGCSLVDAIQSAHQAILAAPAKGVGTAGMGTTVVAALCHLPKVEIAWVGDSRAYLWCQGQLRQLSRDHSYVQGLVDAGALSAEDALTHPDRNIITQSLGSESHRQIKVDSIQTCCAEGDILLLCSDGLTGEVSDAELQQIFSENLSPEALATRLINAANENGGNDNISVVLIAGQGRRMSQATRKMAAITGHSPDPSRQKRILPALAILGLLLVCLLWWLSAWLQDAYNEQNIPTVSGAALFSQAADGSDNADDAQLAAPPVENGINVLTELSRKDTAAANAEAAATSAPLQHLGDAQLPANPNLTAEQPNLIEQNLGEAQQAGPKKTAVKPPAAQPKADTPDPDAPDPETPDSNTPDRDNPL